METGSVYGLLCLVIVVASVLLLVAVVVGIARNVWHGGQSSPSRDAEIEDLRQRVRLLEAQLSMHKDEKPLTAQPAEDLSGSDERFKKRDR